MYAPRVAEQRGKQCCEGTRRLFSCLVGCQLVTEHPLALMAPEVDQNFHWAHVHLALHRPCATALRDGSLRREQDTLLRIQEVHDSAVCKREDKRVLARCMSVCFNLQEARIVDVSSKATATDDSSPHVRGARGP